MKTCGKVHGISARNKEREVNTKPKPKTSATTPRAGVAQPAAVLMRSIDLRGFLAKGAEGLRLRNGRVVGANGQWIAWTEVVRRAREASRREAAENRQGTLARTSGVGQLGYCGRCKGPLAGVQPGRKALCLYCKGVLNGTFPTGGPVLLHRQGGSVAQANHRS